METALSKTRDETYASVLGDPSLRAISEGGMISRPIDLNFFLFQAIVAPDTFLQSIKEIFALVRELSISSSIHASV